MSRLKKIINLNFVISVSVMIALIGGTIFFAMELKKYSIQIFEAHVELDNLSSTAQRLAKLREQKQEADAYLNVLYNVVSSKDELITFSNDIQAIASSEGIGLGFTYSGEEPEGGDKFGSINFIANVETSSFQDVLNFIERLQNFRYLVRIDSVETALTASKTRATIKGGVFHR